MDEDEIIKELEWIGSSRKDMQALPLPVKRVFGVALYVAQLGDTYRAIYTVRFALKVYVLHVFQKKAKHGIATPKRELDLIRERLKRAEALYIGKK